FLRLEDEVAGLAGVAEFGDNAAFIIELDVGLRDRPLVLFPGGEVFAVRFVLGGLLLEAELAVRLLHFGARNRIADLVAGVAGVENLDLVHNHALHHFAIRALDKAVFVDARKTGERTDQTDVRTFRRFDRADAAVVGGVYVADFESGALAAQTARPEGRKT